MAAGSERNNIELCHIFTCFQECVRLNQHTKLVYNGTFQLTVDPTTIPHLPPSRTTPSQTTNKKRPGQKRRDKERFLAWRNSAGRDKNTSADFKPGGNTNKKPLVLNNVSLLPSGPNPAVVDKSLYWHQEVVEKTKPAPTPPGVDKTQPTLTPPGVDLTKATLTPPGVDKTKATLTPPGVDRTKATLTPPGVDKTKATPTPPGVDKTKATLTPPGVDKTQATLTPPGVDKTKAATPTPAVVDETKLQTYPAAGYTPTSHHYGRRGYVPTPAVAEPPPKVVVKKSWGDLCPHGTRHCHGRGCEWTGSHWVTKIPR